MIGSMGDMVMMKYAARMVGPVLCVIVHFQVVVCSYRSLIISSCLYSLVYLVFTCLSGLSYAEIDEKVENDPSIVVCWK